MTNDAGAGAGRRWLAAALGLAMPGLGQLSVDQPVKGLSIFGIFLGVFTVGLRLAVRLPERLLVAGVGTTLLAVLLIWLLAAADAWRGADAAAARASRPWDRWYFYLAVWLLGSVIGTGAVYEHARTGCVEAFKIPSASMEPEVLRGDRLFVDKTAYRRMAPRVGDIVVFVAPDDRSKIFIKRIAALPGDVVTGADGRREAVPHGMAYVLGENTGGSLDSRSFGFIPLRDILGKARQIYWSRGPEGIRWGRIGATL
jgi:signal peptidase I